MFTATHVRITATAKTTTTTRRSRRTAPARASRVVSASRRECVIVRAAEQDDDASTAPSAASTANDDEIPIWERREIERAAAEAKGGLPWPAYLLLSVIVLIAATGSIFEYTYKNPIFGVVTSDSGLYAPILGWFVFTGFPLAGWFWMKGIAGANEASELQDKMDGY